MTELFEDPRVDFYKYYYLDDDTLKSVDRGRVEHNVMYFVIDSAPTTPTDPRFIFGTFEYVDRHLYMNPIIDSTDWNNFPYFLKKNVKEKLKELQNEKNITM